MDKFNLQENQYSFPYHYLVNFEKFSDYKKLSWGIEYYAYNKKVIDILKKEDFFSLLDVGCGDGKLLNVLSDIFPDKKLAGTDISFPAIQMAKGLNHNKNCKFICDDIRSIKDKYDILTLIEVLEHIPGNSIKDFINSAINIVRREGKIIVSVPSQNVPVNKKHYRHYSKKDLLESFNKLKIEKIFFVYKFNLLYKITRFIFSNIFFPGSLRIILAKKFLFDAKESNCKHIICVFKKPL